MCSIFNGCPLKNAYFFKVLRVFRNLHESFYEHTKFIIFHHIGVIRGERKILGNIWPRNGQEIKNVS